MINMSIYHTCLKKYINFSLFWCILEFAKIKTNAVRSLSNLCFFSHFCTQMWSNLSLKQYTLFLQDRLWCTKSRHKMINILFYHDCFKKHINFPVFCCIFGFAKIKQYAIRPPSIFLYFFPNFCLALDENASCFESFNPRAKQTYIRADWSASLHTALISNVMRTCKGAFVQVDQRVHFL